MEVEPARLEVTLPADRPTQGELKITNPGQRNVQVRIQPGAYRFLQPNVRLPSAKEWLSFEPNLFTLAPQASTSVRVLITPASNTPQDTAGEYLAAILVDELPEDGGTTGSSKISIVPRLALPVYLQIEGRKRVELEISEVTARLHRPADTSLAEEEPPPLLHMETVLKNNGTVHLRPTGTVTLFDLATGRLTRGAALGKGLPLLPTETLSVPTWMPLPDPGRYRAIVTVEVQAEEILQKEILFTVTEEKKILQEGKP